MKNFDSTQIEQLKDISQRLHQERQEKSVSLEEIAVKTYIPLRLLQALESGNLERLPEAVFVQGFIRRYADALGLDGMALARTFSTERSPQVSTIASESEPLAVGQTSEPEAMQAPQVPASNEVAIYALPNLHAKLNSSDRKRERSFDSKPSRGPWLLVGAAALLVLGAVALNAFNRSNQPAKPHATAAKPDLSNTTSSANSNRLSSANTAAQPESTSNRATSNQTAAPAPSPSTSTPIEVAVNLVGEAWLQVDVDGKTEYEGILKKGDQRTWTAKKTLTLQSGNAGAVSLSYNQGEAKLLGAPGQVKDITFTSKSSKPAQ